MTNFVANIFGSSPVMPLENHIDLAYQCAKQLRPLFAAAVGGDWSDAERVRADIEKIEQQADEIKNNIRLHLPKSLFMPVPRQDLLELLLVQDKIANLTRDVAGLVVLRKMAIPSPIADDFLDFVDRVIDAAKKARKSVRELDELFSTGFRGAEVELVTNLVNELAQIESDTDNKQMQLNAALYEIESTLNPIDAVYLYRIIELVGEIADMCERVGRRLELLLSH